MFTVPANYRGGHPAEELLALQMSTAAVGLGGRPLAPSLPVLLVPNALTWPSNAAHASSRAYPSRFAGTCRSPFRQRCCMDHPEGCLIIVFSNTGDNLDAT